MSVASKAMWVVGGGTVLSIGFSAIAAGGLSWAVAGEGLKNAGMAAGYAFDVGGSVIEGGGELLQHLSA